MWKQLYLEIVRMNEALNKRWLHSPQCIYWCGFAVAKNNRFLGPARQFKFSFGPVSSHRRNIFIYVICLVCPSISTSCGAKVFNVVQCTQTFQLDSFIAVLLIGSIDFYLFILLTVALTLDCVTGSAESFIFSHTFRVIKMKLNVALKPFKLNKLMLF